MAVRLAFLIIIVGVVAATVLAVRRRRKAAGKAAEQVLRGSAVDLSPRDSEKGVGTAHDTRVPLPLRIGGVKLQASDEPKHFLFAGSTGTGKTQGINQVLRVIRARKARAIVADAGGSALAAFYQPGDLILNPFDRRSVDWSPFAELRADYDRSRLAKAAIPDAEGDSREWHVYAQTLLAEVIGKMHKLSDHSTHELVRYVMAADRQELSTLLAGTAAEMLCAPESDRMLANTRAIASAFLVAWKSLPDNGRFSVRQWIDEDTDGRWCFVTYREDQFEMLRYLIATILDLAVVETLSLSENANRQIWFIMDEVDSLGKIPSLQYALTKMRKYGGRCVLGLQTISQLRATYGEHEAQTLMANVGTKIVLRAGDGETAEYFSREFGSQEILREQNSQTKGYQAKSKTSTEVRETRQTVLDSELTGLPDLHGYLKTPGSLMRIQLDYEQTEKKAEAFVA
jgi:type IV secretory pathway TraG/TraD family ATPase VirD4